MATKFGPRTGRKPTPCSLWAALFLALAIVASPVAARTDYSDLWWNPAEPGWGVNFIQAQTFLFATFFVYDAGYQPVWYTGEMTSDGSGRYEGPLYVTTGSYFSAPQNPAHKSMRQVGTVTFAPDTAATGLLAYTVDGALVTKMVQRQTLQTIPLGDTFVGGLVAQNSGCTDPLANVGQRGSMQLRVLQTAANHRIELEFDLQNGTACRLGGAYEQRGQLYTMPDATYFCSSGLSTTARVTELRATATGIEGRWSAPAGAGCTESASFSAVLAM